MEILSRFQSPERACSYLPQQTATLEYVFVGECSAAEYGQAMAAGWRRFGHMMFRPVCPACQRCQTIRVAVETFGMNRSQKRALKANEDVILKIGLPKVNTARLDLHEKYHAFQSENVGWQFHGRETSDEFRNSFASNPFPTLEFSYWLGTKLIGIGYVDDLPVGLSAIYFFYDPDERDRSLGTFNVLKVIEATKERHLPHMYLGYYVEGCRSLEYKAKFLPNEVLTPSGEWVPFR